MRQFKFRAWHKGYDRPKVKTPIKPRMLYDDRDGDCLQWKAQGQPLIVMQFTGLSDKNGKGIYEGDIITIESNLEWVRGYKYLVQWSPTLVTFYCYRQGDMTGVLGEKLNYYMAYSNIRPGNGYEILGNLYENPEMLNPHGIVSEGVV